MGQQNFLNNSFTFWYFVSSSTLEEAHAHTDSSARRAKHTGRGLRDGSWFVESFHVLWKHQRKGPLKEIDLSHNFLRNATSCNHMQPTNLLRGLKDKVLSLTNVTHPFFFGEVATAGNALSKPDDALTSTCETQVRGNRTHPRKSCAWAELSDGGGGVSGICTIDGLLLLHDWMTNRGYIYI